MKSFNALLLKSAGLAQAICLATALFAPAAHAERIGEIADFAGVQSNALVGYGLVVGLDGTGDQTTQTPFTGQTLVNMLSQLGITVPPGTNMQLKNVAAVLVTAKMGPFSRPGQNLDIVVSSVGNAKTLRGGTLLMTPLKGPDGQVYAIAQGNIMTGGAGASANGSSVAINQQNGGRIPNGAVIEREIPLRLGQNNGGLMLNLREPNFETARRMVVAINASAGRTVASAEDAGMIRIEGPAAPNARVNFIARINDLDIAAQPPMPKVVFNSRTGAVVLNDTVKLNRAAVAHGNLSITIDTTPVVSQPGAFSNGQTATANRSKVSVEQSGRGLHVVEGSANLADVVKALNQLGATPQDLMSILEALKAAGSLRAELEII
jgi:flagellar P-ring protein precursor FlgI